MSETQLSTWKVCTIFRLTSSLSLVKGVAAQPHLKTLHIRGAWIKNEVTWNRFLQSWPFPSPTSPEDIYQTSSSGDRDHDCSRCWGGSFILRVRHIWRSGWSHDASSVPVIFPQCQDLLCQIWCGISLSVLTNDIWFFGGLDNQI